MVLFPNQELLLQHTALMTKERRRWKATAAAKQRAGDRSGGQKNGDKSLAVSPIFCHQMILINQWNLWGTGPVLVGSGNNLEEPKGCCDPSGKNFYIPTSSLISHQLKIL